MEALIALASFLLRSGEDAQRSEALFQEARDLAIRLRNEQAIAQVGFYQAHALLSAGELDDADDLLRDALRRSTNTDFIGWCHWGLGWVALRQGQLEQAATEFQMSLAVAGQVDDDSMHAHVGCALALIAALLGDHDTARSAAANGVQSAERVIGAPRVLMMALALAGQAAILGGDVSATAPVSRLLRILRDKGVTYWADEGLAVSALLLAERLPEEAAIILSSTPSLREALQETSAMLGAITQRLRRCRAQLIETLGPSGWQRAEQQALIMPTEEAIGRALAGLETLSCAEN